MNLQDFMIFILELIGTIAFAASGVMVGIRKQMDLFGVCVLGIVTAVGGGMVRDIVLCQTPSALLDPVYVEASIGTALLIFGLLYFKKDEKESRFHTSYDLLLLLMDSIGLGIFTAVGVVTGIHQGYPHNTFLLTFLGTVTGVGGGLMRDIMAGEPPYIFVKHIYACASVLGALSCILLYQIWGELPAMILSSALVLLIRLLAAKYRWNLPRIHSSDLVKK